MRVYHGKIVNNRPKKRFILKGKKKAPTRSKFFHFRVSPFSERVCVEEGVGVFLLFFFFSVGMGVGGR